MYPATQLQLLLLALTAANFVHCRTVASHFLSSATSQHQKASAILTLHEELRNVIASASQRLSSATQDGSDSNPPHARVIPVPLTRASLRLNVIMASEACRRELQRRGLATAHQVAQLCFAALRRRLQHTAHRTPQLFGTYAEETAANTSSQPDPESHTFSNNS